MHPHREVGPGVLEQVRVRNPAQHAWDKETSLSQPSLQGIGSSLLSVDEGRQVDEHGDILTRARRAYAAQDWRSAAARFDAVPPERLTADDHGNLFGKSREIHRSLSRRIAGANNVSILVRA